MIRTGEVPGYTVAACLEVLAGFEAMPGGRGARRGCGSFPVHGLPRTRRAHREHRSIDTTRIGQWCRHQVYAATFDHGSGLGFQEPESRKRWLPDSGSAVRWVRRGKTKFEGKPSPVDVAAEALAPLPREQTLEWRRRVASFDLDWWRATSRGCRTNACHTTTVRSRTTSFGSIWRRCSTSADLAPLPATVRARHFVVVRQRPDRTFVPIGQLDVSRDGHGTTYSRFRYRPDVASEPEFEPLLAFPDLDGVYKREGELFPFLANPSCRPAARCEATRRLRTVATPGRRTKGVRVRRSDDIC